MINNSVYTSPALTRQQRDLRFSFQSSKFVDEMLKKFEKMESCFQESDLGMECLTLTHQFHLQANSHEKVLSFGKRALKIFIANYDNNIYCFGKLSSRVLTNNGYGSKCMHNHCSSFHIASICHLLGFACLDLKRLEESLSYLNWANRNLTKLEQDYGENSRCTGNCVLHTLLGTHSELFRVKVAMGRKQETVVHALKILEIKEKTLEKGCIELAEGYKGVSDAYIMTADYEEALPFSLKALDIYMKHGVGDDSVELAQVRGNLGTVYGVLGEHNKALELFQLSLNGLKRMERNSLWVNAQIVVANTLIQLGRNEEGLDTFKSILPLTETEAHQGLRACSFTILARGSFNLGNFSDARKYMKTAARVIKKKRISPVVAATAFLDMSRVYEDMEEYEPAISNLRRALAIPELPRKNLIDSCSRLFSLISVTGQEKKGILYLEEAVERLKEKLGPDHCQVGYGYSNLGIAFMNSGQTESAVKLMANAKNILDVSLGPHHLVSLQTSQILSINYANLGSYELAIEIQEKVVRGYKSLGPSEQELLEEAVIYLDKLKGAAAESPTSSSPQSLDGVAVLSETMSNCAISVLSKTSTLFDQSSCKQLPILYKSP